MDEFQQQCRYSVVVVVVEVLFHLECLFPYEKNFDLRLMRLNLKPNVKNLCFFGNLLIFLDNNID